MSWPYYLGDLDLNYDTPSPTFKIPHSKFPSTPIS